MEIWVLNVRIIKLFYWGYLSSWICLLNRVEQSTVESSGISDIKVWHFSENKAH